MAQGQTKDTNKYKPPEHFPDTFATRMRSARSPATKQHKIISNKHKSKTEQKRGTFLYSVALTVLSIVNGEIWCLNAAITCGAVNVGPCSPPPPQSGPCTCP